MNPFHYLGRQA